MIKERPILFSVPMVPPVLARTKTQTRRSLKIQPLDVLPMLEDKSGVEWVGLMQQEPKPQGTIFRCKYGKAGDQLWVRETWSKCNQRPGSSDPVYLYRADLKDGWQYLSMPKWKPSIHMPRLASRIQLEITNIRVERLNDISEEDAMAEGCQSDMTEWGSIYWFDGVEGYESGNSFAASAKEAYKRLWEVINGAGSWDANPWVWVLEFKKLPAEETV